MSAWPSNGSWVRGQIGESSSASRVIRRRRRAVSSADSVLPQYLDCGGAVYVCGYCSAFFWYDERVVRISRRNNVVYSQCCKLGAVSLPPPSQPPDAIMVLYHDRHFIDNIRAYNSMFSMTSFGAKVDDSVTAGRGPYTFKVSGQVSHWISSLCTQAPDRLKVSGQVSHWISSLYTQAPDRPRFLQLYIYDTDNEVQNRLESFTSDGSNGTLRPAIVALLTETLAAHNQYVQTFQNASHVAGAQRLSEYEVRLYNRPSNSRYGLPSDGTLGGIVVADDRNANQYDIIVRSTGGFPHRISKLHQSYMPLQYPLLFPRGDAGWSVSLRSCPVGVGERKAVTVNMYYSYVIHDRYDIYTLLLHGGRLFQQFLVDAYLCIEDSRLDYMRSHKNQLSSEYVSGVYDAISRGDSEGRHIGKRILLPATFVGSPRYMYKHYLDALALCRVYENAQYFITFTCNSKWPEIIRFIESNGMGAAQNRPDIIARIFAMKVSQLTKFLKEDKPFGDVTAYLYTIEFQKRGLPHCHTLLWVGSRSKIRSPADVDKYISAELPDEVNEPVLYSIITSCMLHGPCGLLNSNASCTKYRTCKKGFPKPFQETTSFDKDGYTHYRQRDSAFHTLSSGVDMHNGFVVPYNKRLCSRFNAHINVEYCGWNMVIKYLFKYISKGVDRVSFTIQRADAVTNDASPSTSNIVNEIQNFVDRRFICSHVAAWRILNFPIHEWHPAVQVLAVHLEDMQSSTFNDNSHLQQIVTHPNVGKTTLTRWLVNNPWDPDGRLLTYAEYTSLYRWDAAAKDWIWRTRDTVPAVGRLVYVHPTCGELYYLRLLLCRQKGCRGFSEIRTVAGVTYASYRLACEALGLIREDREWLTAFTDASHWASASELRSLFCHLLLFCEVSNPLQQWEHAWAKMGDDIVRLMSRTCSVGHFVIDDDTLKQHILLELEKLLNVVTPSKSLSTFNLPLPSRTLLTSLTHRLILEETTYDVTDLQSQQDEMASALNPDQLRVYNRIRSDYDIMKQSLLFVYGHGGTGKTFLWRTILAYFRSLGKIVVAVAASGITSLLLPNGRTAHSRFNIPNDITDTSVCNIKKRTQLSDLLMQTSMIIWDEATMTDRRCFECVNRTFRDILDKKDTIFGGMSMLLGGDFRQTLPVKRKRSDKEIIASTLPNSYLWPHFTVYKLMYNMRLSSEPCESTITSSRSHFASWLLDVGNGLIGCPDPAHPHTISKVEIPEQFLIVNEDNSLQNLISFVYPVGILSNPRPECLCSRAIVCPKNDITDDINTLIIQMAPDEVVSYPSTNCITPHSHRMSDIDLLYPQEYLNGLNFPGLPPHKLLLKKVSPIVLLRNINQKDGLCNGTRLIVSRLLPSLIEAIIMTGTCTGKRVHLPRIKLIHKDPELPFIFIRKQFPCRLCYAMTINKSQGQSLKRIGIYLPTPIFSHGQLYVALSRATSPDSIKVLIFDECGKPCTYTTNIVFKNLLNDINSLGTS